MRRRLAIVVLATALPAIGLGLASPVSAITFSECPHSPGFSCATLNVPAVRAQPQLGTITLHIERKLSGSTPTRDAVIALAGGPGQSALPLVSYFAQAMAPALGNRDLVVFDQRGTGESDPLHCPALQSSDTSLSMLVEQCGQQIGAVRSGYATSESVADIDAIRQALGYEKLVLYGTSYGTKVALQYAQTYPSSVEAMVLDSVVQPSGIEPLYLPTLQAIKPVLAELCSQRACAGITSDPLGDLAKLAARMARKPLKGTVYDGSGKRHPDTMGEEQLLEELIAGDLNPALRAMTPAAVISALRGDPEPLLRLNLLSEGLVPNVPPKPAPPQSEEEIDSALLIDTTCEDTAYPWQRSSSPARRLAEAQAALAAQPASSFYPFDAATAENAGLLVGCTSWPYNTPGPVQGGALPDVPTLILSGAQDLRTPTSGARRVAAMIPGSQLLTVPYTGHSVLGSDFSGCAKIAVESFFEGATVLPCGAIPDLFSPTPITPTSLHALRPVQGLPARAGRTLRAVLDTMVDLDRQVIGATLQAEQALPSGSSFGGLRGGYARITNKTVRLHRFSFVPGVDLEGVFPVHKGQVGVASVKVLGSVAAPGSVLIGDEGDVSGVLEGHHFQITASGALIARAAHTERWPGLRRDLLPASVLPPLAALVHQP
ncbi:MAG: alpha/beta fold hydrolase [Solirubrobacteraceae bacterium]